MENRYNELQISFNELDIEDKKEEVENNLDNVIAHVEAIIEYCNKYGEWPKSKETEKIANGYTGHQLARWLNSSGYTKGEFKYSDIEYKGRPVKEILDEFRIESGYVNKLSEESIISYVEAINEYCDKYGEWPKQKETERQSSGYTGQQLARWLNSSGYNKGEFKYSDIEYKGRNIKDILDTLQDSYKQKEKEEYDNVKGIFDMYSEFSKVEEIVDNKEVTDGKQI